MYDIVCFVSGSCHFCIRRRIRYRIRHRMSKIRYRIPNIRYRIRHRIKCTISYVLLVVLAILYTTSHTILYMTSKKIAISHTTPHHVVKVLLKSQPEGPPWTIQALLVSKTLHKSVALCKIRRRGI